MVNSSEHGLSRVIHHKDYYLRGGDMTVLVENHLYRIHSHFFERESLFFRQKFQSSEGEERGSSDNNAFTLDVKSEDFARFLWVFYNPKYSLYEAPLETWLSILQLANRWSFCNVKELTVRELEKIQIEPVDKIAIYHEYTINKLFLVPAYIAVCKREKPLTFAEGMQLGMETVLRVADARERARQRAAESGIRSPTFDDFDDSEMETMIREVFGIASRPTSPIPQTSTSPSYTNGSAYSGSTKVNGSTATTKVNGGGSSTRTNGSSNFDPAARSSIDTTRTDTTRTSFVSAMDTFPSSPSAPASSSPAVPLPENKPTPPAKATPEQTSSPSVAPAAATPTADASKGLWSKPNGSGKPSSLEGTEDQKTGSQALDSSITVVTPTPDLVVPPPVDVKSNDENETIENDAEKDETQTKDFDLSSVLSDSEGGRGGRQGNASRGGKNNNRGGRGGAGGGAGKGKKNQT